MLLLNFFLIFLINKVSLGANILAITTLPSPSHHLFNDVLLLELANRGHNITLLGHDKDKHKNPNYTHIVMEGVYEHISANVDIMGLKNDDSLASIKSLDSYTRLTCHFDFQTSGLRTLLQYPKNFKFDLVIWDVNSGHCLIPLIDQFGNPPIVGINPYILQPNFFKNIYQSYIPFYLRTYSGKMSFWQRLESNFWLIFHELYQNFVFLPEQQKLAKNYFRRTGLEIEKYVRNVSLLLTNYNPVLNNIEALPPNIIPIGGLHINPHQTLPGKLREVLDNAKTGVVLFSLGTNIKSKDLGAKKIRSILKTFSKLRQTVIWKFEYDGLVDLPANVHILKWVPQTAILNHPNTALFVSHGGLLSSHEAIYAGVPVVGIPFYLDQITNVAQLVNKGMAEKLDFDDLETDYFHETLRKVLDNKSYFNTAKILAGLYRDRPMKPLETAVYWVEYALRHSGSPHFDLAVRDMNLVQMLNLDLFLVLLVAILSFVFSLAFVAILTYRKFVLVKNSPKSTKTD